MDFKALAEKEYRFIVGLMSGTSSDGVDAVLVRIRGNGEALAMKFLKHETFPYTPGFRTRLLSSHFDARDVCLLNFEIGKRLAEAAKAMVEYAKQNGAEVDCVASHGHTIAHYPPPKHDPAGTLQIGEAAVIAEETGLPVVSDFRPRDMAAGGQGAPLVPYADWLLFRRADKTKLCLNIGGIANFTVVTPKFEDIVAFDTGPGNMTIDGTVRLLTKGGREMDEDGRAAARGLVIDEFLEYLLSHEYFNKVPPKSTGREEFGVDVYLRDALLNRREHSYEDLVATVTMAVAQSIINAYHRFVKPNFQIEHLIVGGGGVKNKRLMRLLHKGLPELQIFTSDQFGIPHAAREALAFAILANETLCGLPANVPQATGARRPVILGKITPA
ncbi:MAG: anhydro-N-acetylmuramic acid kinase [Candidatus Hydrogenedentes bacterium]|nr:anhydro-N-acetylmuramic acid kinase [Candidatus Hydrogenedentota bacterium]